MYLIHVLLRFEQEINSQSIKLLAILKNIEKTDFRFPNVSEISIQKIALPSIMLLTD